MGLLPLEFTDGLTDSPFFRETLQAHERELDLTNTAIKHLIKDIKDLIVAARNLSRAQRTLSETLNNFNFECIGNSQTDDEMIISNSFKDFARLLSTIEDERDRLLEKADEAFLEPIERFRRDQIGSAKDAKKKFEKETTKYCQNLERYLNLSVKKSETQLWEADANNSMEQQHFFKAMSEYVLKLQEVNERKKFEFVETVLSFMLGWLTFYHQGHEIATDFYSVKMELQMRLQRTRNNFNMTQEETKSLRKKMLENQEKFRQKFQDSCSLKTKTYSRQGYLFLMEKKAFTTSWTKHFCKYDKQRNRLKMIQYTQTTGKIVSTDEIIVKECIKRNQDTIDRRFCFDIVAQTKDETNSNHNHNHHQQQQQYPCNEQQNNSITPNGGNSSNIIVNNNNQKQSDINNINSSTNDSSHVIVYTFQAISEEDYKYWLETLNARDPYPINYSSGQKSIKQTNNINNNNKLNNNEIKNNHNHNNDVHSNEIHQLDIEGYWFVKKCINTIELHGLDQKGIYRMVGVASRVRSLMELFAQSKSLNQNYDDNNENDIDRIDLLPNFNVDTDDFETKTITSALKNYLRNLNEPIMTFKLHHLFINAAKLENRNSRIEKIHQLVHRLPSINFKVLKILIEHLQKVAKLHDKNLMTSSNLGVCFGPTLLRTAEESVAAIMDIKFVNVIAELLIENYEKFFLSKPTQQMEQEQQKTHQSIPNYINNQIQQRPLPNVPISQSQQQHYVTKTIYEKPNNNPLMQLPSNQQSSTNIYISQDQLQTKSRALYCQNNQNSIVPNINGISSGMLMGQHLKQYSLNYPTYSNCNNNNAAAAAAAARRALHLSLSSSSPSPSLGLSTMANTAIQHQPNLYLQPQHLQHHHHHHQQQQILHKQISSNAIYGQIRTTNSNQLLQPSISYQNLHYNNDLSVALSNDNSIQKKSPTGLNSNRPMTSMGITPPNSNYASLIRSESNENETTKFESINKNNYSPITNESQSMHSNFIQNQQQPSTPTAITTSTTIVQQHPIRSMNFSSSSSTSLPSTPEHSHQQSQFQYKFSTGTTVMKSPSSTTTSATSTTTAITTTSLPMNRNPIIDQIVSKSTDPITELYSSNNNVDHSIQFNHSHQQQQQPSISKSIYASISSPSSPPRSMIGRTVRTRYVCIGGPDSELSFQPNMIITNVRPSREPGWLEGTLNGKTGLIPLNYVEYID